MENEQFLFINQFDYDVPTLKKKRKAETNKIVRKEYEALIHIKTMMGNCMSGDYKSYPALSMSFNDENVDKEIKKYVKIVKPILMAINRAVTKLIKHYEVNYVDYPRIFSGKSIYEITDMLIKDDLLVNQLVNDLKSVELPFKY